MSDRTPDAEVVLLSTCNRVEFYLAAPTPDRLPPTEMVAECLAANSNMAHSEVRVLLAERAGAAVASRLFSVAAGLESIAVGEAHIAGQVKTAYEMACEEATAGATMHRLFQAALRTARRIAAETNFQSGRVSIPSLAIGEFAKRVLKRLDDKRALIVGAGRMADESMKHLSALGTTDLVVVNRSPGAARTLATKWSAKSAPWDSLWKQLGRSDVVVCATGSPKPIVKVCDFEEQASCVRRRRPLFAVDLGVPRDIEPAIGQRPGVHLVAIDDLKSRCRENRAARRLAMPSATKIVSEEAERFLAESRFRKHAPTIRRLRAKWDEAKDAEFTRLVEKLPGLPEASRREVEYALERLLAKLMHPPLTALRRDASRGESASNRAIESLSLWLREEK